MDKPNVRFVIHASVPGSLPAYIQEAGRAGRDGQPSECVVIYRGADLGRRKRLVTINAAGADEVESFFRALARVASAGRVNLPPTSLGSLGGVEPDLAGVLLGGLEEAGLISRGYDLWGDVEVRRVDEEHGEVDVEVREEVVRVHAALPGEGTVSLPELARRAGVRPVAAQTALFKLMTDGMVEAVPRGLLADIRLKNESLDEGSRRSIAARLKSRTRAAYDQIRTVETYVTLETCRREHLLRHFGDGQEVAPCAGCDICLGEVDEAPDLSAGAPLAATTAVAQHGIPAAERATVPVERSNAATGAPPDVAIDDELFERLRTWRGDQARSQQVPAYVVLHNSHLEEIARRKPKNVHELGSIKGVGLRRAARYGDELLALVRGQEPVPLAEVDGSDYRQHLQSAERLLNTGSGAAAVLELARALEVGGEEAKRAVDALLAP